ncbi:hypothetical protein OG302_02365 [Streptomyces sp. NBC_01283]|uniref:hypothetical protein n=1 Tax=Streptomyces sp. NBC_01283 TaxID=2903812 RepID=UPI00352FC8AB|nr:hypothetical protein OG302_02365 [Streptomyces sp. NBC_01283]
MEVLHEEYAKKRRLRTEESMGGPFLILFFSDAKLHTALEKWLKGLKKAVEA